MAEQMNKTNRTISLLKFLLHRYESYHNQKENIAHAGLVIQIALFGALIKWNNILIDLPNMSKLSIIIIISIFWLLLHMFIRIQLRLKRWAALNFAGCYRAFVIFTSSNDLRTILTRQEAIEDDNQKWYQKFLNYFITGFDFIFPIAQAPINSDFKNVKYPKFIVDCIKAQYSDYKTGSTKYEWFFTFGSIFMIALIILSIIY